MDAEKENRLREYLNKFSKEELIERELRSAEQGISTLAKDFKDDVEIKQEALDVIHDCIMEKIRTEEFINSILMQKSQYNYGAYEPTQFTKNLMNKVVDEDFFTVFKENLHAFLTEHYEDICKNVLLDVFLAGLTNRNVITNAVKDVVCREQSPIILR